MFSSYYPRISAAEVSAETSERAALRLQKEVDILQVRSCSKQNTMILWSQIFRQTDELKVKTYLKI